MSLSVAEPLELYQFFKRNVPCHQEQSINSLIERINAKRTELILRERVNSVCSLLTDKSIPKGVVPKGLSSQEIFKLITTSEILTSHDVRPSFMQLTGLLIPFLYENAETFAKAVCKSAGSKNFDFIRFSVVPAVFGFFVSAENMTAAENFYLNVMKIAPVKVAIQILRPFMGGLPCFRYVEAVMSEVSVAIGSDRNINNSEMISHSVKKYTDSLARAMTSKVGCLPRTFFVLFSEMLRLNWGHQDLLNLLFDHFMIPEGSSYMRASPFSRCIDFFMQVVRNLVNNQACITKLINAMFMGSSFFEVPSLYAAFDQKFVITGITIADVAHAVWCYQTVGEMPSTMAHFNYEEYDPEVRYIPFIVRAFPKGIEKFPKFPRVVFPEMPEMHHTPTELDRLYHVIKQRADKEMMDPYEYSVHIKNQDPALSVCLLEMTIQQYLKNALRFEKTMYVTMSENELDKWNSLSLAKADVILIEKYLIENRALEKEKLSSEERFAKVSNGCASLSVKRVLFFECICDAMDGLMKKHAGKFSRLESACSEVIAKRRVTRSLASVSSLSVPVQSMFWEDIYGILKNISMIPRSRQFEVIMTALKHIDVISSSQDFTYLCSIAIEFGEAVSLPGVFLLLNSLAIRNGVFGEYLDEIEHLLWLKFESFLLQYSVDPELPDFNLAFMDLQMILMDF